MSGSGGGGEEMPLREAKTAEEKVTQGGGRVWVGEKSPRLVRQALVGVDVPPFPYFVPAHVPIPSSLLHAEPNPVRVDVPHTCSTWSMAVRQAPNIETWQALLPLPTNRGTFCRNCSHTDPARPGHGRYSLTPYMNRGIMCNWEQS